MTKKLRLSALLALALILALFAGCAEADDTDAGGNGDIDGNAGIAAEDLIPLAFDNYTAFSQRFASDEFYAFDITSRAYSDYNAQPAETRGETSARYTFTQFGDTEWVSDGESNNVFTSDSASDSGRLMINGVGYTSDGDSYFTLVQFLERENGENVRSALYSDTFFIDVVRGEIVRADRDPDAMDDALWEFWQEGYVATANYALPFDRWTDITRTNAFGVGIGLFEFDVDAVIRAEIDASGGTVATRLWVDTALIPFYAQFGETTPPPDSSDEPRVYSDYGEYIIIEITADADGLPLSVRNWVSFSMRFSGDWSDVYDEYPQDIIGQVQVNEAVFNAWNDDVVLDAFPDVSDWQLERF